MIVLKRIGKIQDKKIKKDKNALRKKDRRTKIKKTKRQKDRKSERLKGRGAVTQTPELKGRSPPTVDFLHQKDNQTKRQKRQKDKKKKKTFWGGMCSGSRCFNSKVTLNFSGGRVMPITWPP